MVSSVFGRVLVKSVRNYIDDILLPKDIVPTRWIKVVPIKVNVMAWRVWLDNLPTRYNLSTRGLELPSIICPTFNISTETISHLFFSYDLDVKCGTKCYVGGTLIPHICYRTMTGSLGSKVLGFPKA